VANLRGRNNSLNKSSTTIEIILTGGVMDTKKIQEEVEVQIFNPVLNEGLYLAQDLCDPSTQEILFKRGRLLTVNVLLALLVVGYEFIPTMTEEA